VGQYGVLIDHRALICDRDRKWTLSVRQLVAGSGIRSVQTPFQAPNANAYAERFVRSIKDECQSRDSFGGTPPATDDRGVRRPLSPGAKSSGLGNELIDPVFRTPGTGCIRRRERLGGLLNYYYRAA